MSRTASLLVIPIILLATGCHGPAVSLWTPGPLTLEAEALAGAKAALQLEARYGGVIRDADAEHRLGLIGARLCRGSSCLQGSYHYRLLDSNSINAFSLPGGRIYVTRGLYARLTADDEMLAAVVAHEMAHIVSKDHFKTRCSDAGESLDRELAADARAVRYLRGARIPPEAMLRVIRAIEDVLPQGWSNTRADSVRESMAETDRLGTLARART